MHGIYELESMLCDELDEYGKKGELTAGSLDTIDKLTHALKNTQKVIEYYETMGDYISGDGMPYNSYARGNRGGNHGVNQYGSYARGRRNNSYMGDYYRGYGRDGGVKEMVQEIHNLMEDAPNHKIKQKMQEVISELETVQ